MRKTSKLIAMMILIISFLPIIKFVEADPETTVTLQDIDSGTTSPAGDYRWRDVADTLYNETYRSTYNYALDAVEVTLTYSTVGLSLHGTLEAFNLKPNFAYQMKIVGEPGTETNEKIGSAGRYWKEEWNGAWVNGENLNNKGDGYSPNPNDDVYSNTKDTPDPTSPTGLEYRYTGYMVFDYFITDSNGYAFVPFEVSSSYHVLWKTTQSYEYNSEDGPIKTTSFEPPNPTHPAYKGTSYPLGTIEIIGEWERKPVGGVYLTPLLYSCKFVLTEESFHGSGGVHAGNWAAAMGANISFEIESINVIPEFPLGTIMGVFSFFISLFFWRKLK